MPFNPDQYLAEKTGPMAAPSQGFDPDKYLQEKAAPKAGSSDQGEESILDKEVPLLGGTGRGYAKGALNALPTVGMVGGGLLGAGAGPVGAVGGAGLGGAAGTALKNFGEKLLGEDKTREQIYGDPLKAGVEGATAEMGGQVIGAGAKAAASTKAGQKVLGLLGKGAAKVGETFSGVPEKEIMTYANHADEIKEMAKASDNSTAEAADQMRAKFMDQIQGTKSAMNKQISDALESSTKSVDSAPILKALEDSKTSINPKLNPEGHEAIDSLIKRISSLSDEKGALSIKDANDIKRYLQDQASSAYYGSGQIFSGGTEAANAAKAGARAARSLVNEAEPAIAQANNKLAELHDVMDDLNKNMISEGKPEAALLSAGSGGNPRNAKNLTRLGELTGNDMTGDAEKLSAMRTFGSPKLIAQDSTGKAAGRMGLAGGLGFLAGHAPGAVAAAFLTSPAAVKTAIDAGKLTRGMLKDPSVQQMLGRGLLKVAEDSLSEKEDGN